MRAENASILRRALNRSPGRNAATRQGSEIAVNRSPWVIARRVRPNAHVSKIRGGHNRLRQFYHVETARGRPAPGLSARTRPARRCLRAIDVEAAVGVGQCHRIRRLVVLGAGGWKENRNFTRPWPLLPAPARSEPRSPAGYAPLARRNVLGERWRCETQATISGNAASPVLSRPGRRKGLCGGHCPSAKCQRLCRSIPPLRPVEEQPNAPAATATAAQSACWRLSRLQSNRDSVANLGGDQNLACYPQNPEGKNRRGHKLVQTANNRACWNVLLLCLLLDNPPGLLVPSSGTLACRRSSAVDVRNPPARAMMVESLSVPTKPARP